MQLTARLNTVASQITVWTIQHPTATRLILLALPFVIAGVVFLATSQSAFACPTPNGCSGGD